MGEFPSGQRGQTVNLLLFSFGGPNPPSPTSKSPRNAWAFRLFSHANIFCSDRAVTVLTTLFSYGIMFVSNVPEG